MKEVNLRKSVVTSLKSSLERRLLNAGVNTSEVLEAYTATVRALKYIDPSGILVQLVTPPVREYLKHREETVRVILISLTDETGELSEELARNPTNPDKNNKITLANWKNWEPGNYYNLFFYNFC
jgi:anaphase-promoting complex subunit 2